MAFTKKRIKVEVFLRAGKTEDGSDKITIEGLPISVTINKGGFPSFNEASMQIWGLSLDKMKALKMVGFYPFTFNRNRVKIYAGDTDPLPLIFVGEQTSGIINMSESGEASITLKAFTSVFAAQTPSKPVAYKDSVPAADVIAQLCKEAGYKFVNEGVTSSVKNSVFRGDVMKKMQLVAEQVDANLICDDQTVILLPKGKPRKAEVDVISAETGLIGYPQLTSRGVTCRCLFRPYLKYGQAVKVKSIMPMASGTHRIYKLTHNIEAFKNDGGAWFTTFEALFNTWMHI